MPKTAYNLFSSPLRNSAVSYPIKTVDQLAPTLKAFRRAAGLTQADLAARLGITQQTYARLETNPQTVSLARFLRVLSVLDVQMTLATSDPASTRPRQTTTAASGDKTSASAAKRVRQTSAANVAAATARKKARPDAAAPEQRPATTKRKPARRNSNRAPRPVVSKREPW